MPPLIVPIADTKGFSLNTSGVTGFFGGEEAITAMTTVHLYRGRRWLGWYNSPGSYTVAKELGRISKSRLWDSLFPGPNDDPFKLDVKTGPKYVASCSATVMQQTGHIAHLLMQETDNLMPHPLIGSRMTCGTKVSVVVIDDTRFQYSNLDLQPMSIYHTVLASFPILISLSACILSALAADWYCFAIILLGIISNGVTCFVIGSSGDFRIEGGEKPPTGSSSGDGVFVTQNGKDIVILKGSVWGVSIITKGRFSVRLDGGPEYRTIGLCSLLLEAQFLLQLILIPQGSLFGQIMFLTSIITSWVYNSFLQSLDKEKIQRKLLFDAIGLDSKAIFSCEVGTRAAMAAFACFVLCEDLPRPLIGIELMKILRELSAMHKTPVWQKWGEQVVAQVEKEEDEMSILQPENVDMSGLKSSEQELLAALLKDANDAYKGIEW
ncbi:hypothetical protein EDB19DRAFT_1830258 [Suillus lakei]|nr:hypothetical protein EDB19DRAFT_1830258 [Suillus lakei]